MNLWGYCSGCARWFYVDGDGGQCPVCQADPERLEHREEPGA